MYSAASNERLMSLVHSPEKADRTSVSLAVVFVGEEQYKITIFKRSRSFSDITFIFQINLQL
jgi:hypothetical protein